MNVSSKRFNKRRVMRELRDDTENLRINGDFDAVKGDQILSDTFLSLCEATNSPVSLACWLRFKHGEFLQLVSKDVKPTDYLTVDGFRGDYLCTSFLSKYPDFNIGVDRKKRALQKWLSTESACSLTNEVFRKFWSGEFNFRPDVAVILHYAQREIQNLLGPVPRDLLMHGRFGPGADLSTRGNRVTRSFKYSSSGTCTPGLLSLVADFFDDDMRDWFVHDASLVNSSRLTFVPKNSLIDRAICVEPRWNVFFQLSVMHCISRRLKVFGFDSSDQSRNVELARRAYADRLSTIDLSSASDCVAKNLVLDLLPEDWADIIFKLRAPTTLVDGKLIALEKVSSMGNGYTFPLETLIFAGLARAVARYCQLDFEDIAVYGDDIIVPESMARQLIDVLNAVGFSVNTKKTYLTGDFFESCGSDFFRGQNVRPIFLKERVSNVEGAIRLANQITEYACRTNSTGSACSRIMASRRAAINGIPKSLRFFGPVNGGDGVIHDTFDRVCPLPAGNGWQGFYIKSIVSEPVRYYRMDDPLLLSKLDGPDAPGNFVTRRGSVRRKVALVYVLDYADFAVS